MICTLLYSYTYAFYLHTLISFLHKYLTLRINLLLDIIIVTDQDIMERLENGIGAKQ